MNLTRFSVALAACSLFACSAPTAEPVSDDHAAITGSMKRAEAIAIRDAYVAADVSALTPLNPNLESIPDSARTTVQSWIALNPTFSMKVESAASMSTPIGKVFVVERSISHPSWDNYERELDFFDEFGTWRLYGIESFKWDGTPSNGMHFFWVSETPGTDQLLP
jgi:hypothetical protein